ncbi:MAG: hypothetical protein JO122_00460 [Acetobacteraceae bacterium]|nr:hypothetical protein [Acetobacteraceae bacterium]
MPKTVSFLIVGDGYPASRITALVNSMPAARVIAVARADAASESGVRTTNPDSEAVTTDFLVQEAGVEWVRRVAPDWLLCINSTKILPPELIDLFEQRALNAHPGLLPEYAGLHAHQWALRNGESEHGATVHRMKRRIDSGPIVAASRFPIRDDDTGLSLFRRTLAEAVNLLGSLLPRIVAGEALPSVPQDLSRRRVYRHRDALDGGMDWRSPARAIVNFVRAGNYEPFDSPTFVPTLTVPSGASIKVLQAKLIGPTTLPPGSVIGVQEQGPVIACGDGQAVIITRARHSLGILSYAEWRAHFASGFAAS